jgi:hypothetical protein
VKLVMDSTRDFLLRQRMKCRVSSDKCIHHLISKSWQS